MCPDQDGSWPHSIYPGMANTGWAVVEFFPDGKIRCLSGGTINTKASQPEGQRLEFIASKIKDIIDKFQSITWGYEKTNFNKPNMEKLYKATGAIMVLCQEAGVEFKGFQPQVIKQGVCGSRTANKDQVERYVEAIIKAKLAKCSEHQIDAIDVAITDGNVSQYNKKIRGESF